MFGLAVTDAVDRNVASPLSVLTKNCPLTCDCKVGMEDVQPQHRVILQRLQNLIRDERFTDFKIQLQDGEVQIGRVFFAAMSSVFHSTVTVEMAESTTNRAELPNVSVESWNCITDFYYTTEKSINRNNVVDLVAICHRYQLDELKEYCGNFIFSNCDVDNCIAVMRVASEFNLQAAERKACLVLSENFSAVCKSVDFLCLEKPELLNLVKMEYLNTTEDALCRGLLIWMDERDADSDICLELFSALPLESISDEFLRSELVNHSVTRKISAMQEKVQEEISRRKANVTSLDVPSQHVPPRKRPGHSTASTIILGRTEDQHKMLLWSAGRKEWLSLPDPPEEVGSDFSATVLGNTLIVTGPNTTRSTHMFELTKQLWTEGPRLLRPRSFHGMTVIQNRAFVVAGYSRMERLTSIEEYRSGGGGWTHSGDLQKPTDDCGVAALEDAIIVVGDGDGPNADVVQVFNVITGTCVVLEKRLSHPMRHVRAARYNDIACFVGEDGQLVKIGHRDGNIVVFSAAPLAGFGRKEGFGLGIVQDLVRVFGGGETQAVGSWSLDGERREMSDVPDLPMALEISAVVQIHLGPSATCSSSAQMPQPTEQTS